MQPGTFLIILEAYELILGKYTEETVIFDHYSVDGIYPAMEDYGVLPNLREGHTPIVLLNESPAELVTTACLQYTSVLYFIFKIFKCAYRLSSAGHNI